MTWLVALTLGACGERTPPPRLGPDPDAAANAARSFCKLLQGAGRRCTAEGPAATTAGHTLTFAVEVTEETVASGHTRMALEVDVAVDGQPRPELSSPASADGTGSRRNLLEHAFHGWAMVYGIPAADSVLADPARPVLAAVDPQVGQGRVGARDLYRGWTVLTRADATYLDHRSLLAHLDPVVSTLGDGWHSLSVEVRRDAGATTTRCRLDGAPHEATCTTASSWSWPVSTDGAEITQFYLFSPPRPAPPPEVAPPEAAPPSPTPPPPAR